MSKIWFFVEGDTEYNCVINVVRKNFPTILPESDLKKFVESQGDNICYIEICGNVNKIPHKINNRYYLIEDTEVIIVVLCDVERLACFTNRKNQIESQLDNSVDISKINHVFNIPMIENNYWTCPDHIVGVLKKEYRLKFNKRLKRVNLNGYPHTLHGLKSLFTRYDLKYRERQFSENYFGRIADFSACPNNTMVRLINKISGSKD